MTRGARAAGSKGWSGALRSATLTGAAAACTTGASVSATGKRDSGSAIHLGACIFWATVYERWFGRAAERGDLARALAGAGAVAAAAYVTDYRLVPRRLTPGWEQRLSAESMAAAYFVLALTLPLRGLLSGTRRHRRAR